METAPPRHLTAAAGPIGGKWLVAQFSERPEFARWSAMITDVPGLRRSSARLGRPSPDSRIMVTIFVLLAAQAACGGTSVVNDGTFGKPPPDGSSVLGSATDSSSGADHPEVDSPIMQKAFDAGADATDDSVGDGRPRADASDAGASDGALASEVAADAHIFVGCPASFVPPPRPQPLGTGATMQDQIAASELATLDPLIGAFLRGDVLVYRGTVAGSSTILPDENTPPDTKELQVPSGPALAKLAVRPASQSDWYPRAPAPTGDAAFLMIYSLGSHVYDIYGQSVSDPSTTWVGTFDSYEPASTNAFNMSCTSCAPVLATQPSTISLQGLVATGSTSVYQPAIGGYVAVPFTTKTTATLALVPPCALSWDDLSTLDTVDGVDAFASDVGLQSFQQQGDEMVSHRNGPSGVPPNAGCTVVTPYSIDVWVKRENLTMMGTRNLQIGAPEMICRGGV